MSRSKRAQQWPSNRRSPLGRLLWFPNAAFVERLFSGALLGLERGFLGDESLHAVEAT